MPTSILTPGVQNVVIGKWAIREESFYAPFRGLFGFSDSLPNVQWHTPGPHVWHLSHVRKTATPKGLRRLSSRGVAKEGVDSGATSFTSSTG
jgi:hypothetical protein